MDRLLDYFMEQAPEAQRYYLTALLDPLSKSCEPYSLLVPPNYYGVLYLAMNFYRDVEEIRRTNGRLGLPLKYQELQNELMPILDSLYPLCNFMD